MYTTEYYRIIKSVGFSEGKTPPYVIAIWVGKKEAWILSRWIIKATKAKKGVTFALSEYHQGRDTLSKNVELLYVVK